MPIPKQTRNVPPKKAVVGKKWRAKGGSNRKTPEERVRPAYQIVPLEERARQVESVIALMKDGIPEGEACVQVGIDRGTFRSNAFRVGSSKDYAQALATIAQTQVNNIESVIEDMRTGRVDAAMARVEIEARKWMASKFAPREFGDRVTQEVTGANGGPLQVAAVDWKGLSADELARIADIASKVLPQ